MTGTGDDVTLGIRLHALAVGRAMMRALALGSRDAGEGLHRRVYFIGNSFTYRYGEPTTGRAAGSGRGAAARGDNLEQD